MIKKFYTLTLFAAGLFVVSCKTAGKLYQKGNYDAAVELAAKKLRKDPDDPKLLTIIQSAYRYAVTDHENRIRNNAASSNELKWEWMYYEYAALQRMYEAIVKVPEISNLIRPADYSSYLVTYSEKAGSARNDRGLASMQLGNKQGYRNAYREFQAAEKFKPGNLDIIRKMNEAYDNAVTNVVILPLDRADDYRTSSYNNSYANFYDQLLQSLKYNTGNEFVKFYPAWEAKTRNIRADQVVDMRLATLNIGRTFDNKTTRRVSKEVVIREIVYRPDSVVKVMGRVYAEITTTKRSMYSDALLQVNASDGNGGWLWSDHIRADQDWVTEFASFTGDERALDENDRQLINSRQEQPPRNEEIYKCLMEEIHNNTLARIRNYANRF